MKCFIIVREERPGQFVAWPAGIPELKVTAESRAGARDAMYSKLFDWLQRGELIAIDLPDIQAFAAAVAIGPEDQAEMEQVYLDEIRRLRREADIASGVWDIDPNNPDDVRLLEEARKARQNELKGTAWDYDLPCPSSLSTPIT